MRSKLLILGVLLGQFCVPTAGRSQTTLPTNGSKDTPATVYLLRPARHSANSEPPLLSRELMRQALLVAAREELGLWTRDAVLRELPLQQPGGRQFQMSVEVEWDKEARQLRSAIRLAGKPDSKPVEFAFAYGNSNNPKRLLEVIERAEALSREAFPAMLKEAGLSGAAVKNNSKAALAPEVLRRLDEMDLFAQYDVVRQAHAAMQRDGQSPALLAALVRGYANLGQLTAFQWSSIAKVCQARSLLYAQRLAIVDPDSAVSRWHRAYAYALVGLHAAALEDLEEAAKRGTDPAPAWVELIEPLCRYDTATLADLAGRETDTAPLATLMCLLSVEHCTSAGVVARVGMAGFDRMPTCFRLLDAVCQNVGVGAGHAATQMGFEAMVRALRAELPKIGGMPPDVDRAWQAARKNPDLIADVASVSRAFVATKHPAEPSWGLLGRMLEETSFVHVYRRAYFMGRSWSVENEDYIRQMRPLMADHPYRSLIDATDHRYGRRSPQRRKMLAELDIVDMQPQMYDVIDETLAIAAPGKVQGNVAWRLLSTHRDTCAADLDPQLLSLSRDKDTSPGNMRWLQYTARRLRSVSPHSPVAMAALIYTDWEKVEGQVPQWIEQFPRHPAIHAALGRRYTTLGRLAEAEPHLRTYIEAAPELWAYTVLANNYLKLGQEDKWLQTLESYLEQEDLGLGHARVRVRIAEHFMAKGQYARAMPYADAAAQTWAAWAMSCAARCAEGLGDWETAELWTRRRAERYDDPDDWYKWCRRTGHGDVAGARRQMQGYLRKLESSDDREHMVAIASFYLAEQQYPKAAAALHGSFDASGDPWAGLHLVLIYDSDGKAAQRDAALSLLLEKGPAFRLPLNGAARPDLVELGRLFDQGLSAAGDPMLDLAAVDKLVSASNPDERTNIQYFAGRFLWIHGRKDDARRYLEDCVRGGRDRMSNHLLAVLALREMGVELPVTRPATDPAADGSADPAP